MNLHVKFFNATIIKMEKITINKNISVFPIRATHRTMPLLIKNEVTIPIIERSRAIR